MTTNITPIEAKTREAIKKHKNCKHRQFCKSTLRGKWIDCMLGKGLVCNPNLHYCKYEKYIPRETAQALAPQECDVNCVFCERIEGLDNLVRCTNKEHSLTFCHLNTMQFCNLNKQLHSPKKTFTVDEVKEITKLQQEKTIKEMMDLFKKIFAEFKKAVE